MDSGNTYLNSEIFDERIDGILDTIVEDKRKKPYIVRTSAINIPSRVYTFKK